ncbi:hypothetical protein CPC08DRAFT_765293 [Agrocybe pediades]|nr:hypothetical protein CPC08DRAFT_765293 [Agrocybe pediades]
MPVEEKTPDKVPLATALQPLFDWSPPEIKVNSVKSKSKGSTKVDKLKEESKSKMHTGSTGTRPPKFYDMHLHKRLRLKEIVLAPDMLQKLTSLCDERVSASSPIDSATVGEIQQDWDDTIFEKNEVKEMMAKITDEATLVRYYKHFVGEIITQAVSLILFGHFTELDGPGTSKAILKWCEGTVESGSGQTRAIADAFVQSRAQEAAEVPDLSKETKEAFQLVQSFQLNNIIPKEFKNTVAGFYTLEHMHKIVGPFRYTACQDVEDGQKDALCGQPKHLHRDAYGQLIVTGRGTSPDGEAVEHFASSGRTCRETGKQKPTVEKPCHEHCEHVAQQGWAEAVANDSTFLFFSCGNVEYIGIRDRANQILYISERIDLRNLKLSYAKIMLGLCIAAFEDAVDRARRFAQVLDKKSLTFSEIVEKPKLYLENSPVAIARAESINLAAESSESLAKLNQDLLRDLTSRKCITLRLHGATIGIFRISPNDDHWIFSRVTADGEPKVFKTKPAGRSSEMDVFLGYEKQIPHSSKVFEVYLAQRWKDESGRFFTHPNSLIMKVAIAQKDIEALIKEYLHYCDMKRRGVPGILNQYGLYSCRQDTRTKCFILLLEHGGPSLLTHAKRFAHIGAHRRTYEQALDKFWKQRYIHGSILPEHILMKVKTHSVSVISLAQSVYRGTRKQLKVDKEYLAVALGGSLEYIA